MASNNVWNGKDFAMRPILGRPSAVILPSDIQIALLTDQIFRRLPDRFSPSLSTTDSVFSSDFSASSTSSDSPSPLRSPIVPYPPSPTYNASSSAFDEISKGHVSPHIASRLFSLDSACSSTSSSESPPPSPSNEIDDFSREFARCLFVGRKPKSVPPENYICHVCYKGGHYIQNCPKKATYETNTPYQGVKHCFGLYKCSKCKRKWTSTKSYAELKQECKKCKIGAFPYKQMRLNVARSKGLYIEK